MEQKLVQRCETEIVADACNASYALKPPMLPCFIFLYPKNKGEIPKTMPDNPKNVVHPLYWRPVQLLIRHHFWDLRNNPINVAWQLLWVEMLDSLLSGIFLGSQKQSQKWCQIIIRQLFGDCQWWFLASLAYFWSLKRTLRKKKQKKTFGPNCHYIFCIKIKL